MKLTSSLALIALSLSSTLAFAGEPKAAMCGDVALTKAIKSVLALNRTPKEMAMIQIVGSSLNQFDYGANGNEITEWDVAWKYKSGEMAGDINSFTLNLSSAGLDRTGRCLITGFKNSDIVK